MSICHESGFLFYQHLIVPHDWEKWHVRNMLHAAKEFVVESVAWLICERLRVENTSERYFRSYLTVNNEIRTEVSIERILYGVNEIRSICSLETNSSYRYGLLYRHCDDYNEMVKHVKEN